MFAIFSPFLSFLFLSKKAIYIHIYIYISSYVGSLRFSGRVEEEEERIKGEEGGRRRRCRRDRSVRRTEVGTKEAIHRWRGLLPNPHKAPHVATKSKFTFRAQT